MARAAPIKGNWAELSGHKCSLGPRVCSSGSFPPPRTWPAGLSQQGPPPPPSLLSHSGARQPAAHCQLQHVAPGGRSPPPAPHHHPAVSPGGFHSFPPTTPTVTSRKSSARPHPLPPSRGCQAGAAPSSGGLAFSPPLAAGSASETVDSEGGPAASV